VAALDQTGNRPSPDARWSAIAALTADGLFVAAVDMSSDPGFSTVLAEHRHCERKALSLLRIKLDRR
jgi:hypothetical protein